MLTTLDIGIIIIYVILVIIGGVIVQYIKKVKEHLTFIVAKSQAPWYIVMGLLIAEMIHGGQTIGYTGWLQVFKGSALWYLIIIAVGFLWQIPVAVKVRKEELRTIPEIILTYMDAKCSIINGVINCFFYITVMSAVCYLSFAALAKVLFGWPAWLSMLIIAIPCIIYPATAGLWSIGWLNFIQYVVILIGTGIAAFYGISAVGGYSQLMTQLPPDFWDMLPGPVGVGFILLMIIFFWYFGYMIWAGTNRSLMSAKNPRHSAYGAIAACLGYIPFLILITLAGMAAYVLYTVPGILESPDHALPRLIMEHVPTGMAGVALAAIMAAIITTSANCLFATGTTLSYDIVHKFIKPDASDRWLINFARLMMAILGIIMLIVCLYWQVMVLYALSFAYAIAAGGIILPSFYTYLEHLWGRTKRTLLTPDGYFWGCVIGFISALAWYFITGGDVTWACPFGALFSGVFSLGISALQRIKSRESLPPLTRSEKWVRAVAILVLIPIIIAVPLRIAGIIW